MNVASIKTALYEWWHGHPFLVKEEADIICDVRFDHKFKHLNDSEIKTLVKIRVDEMYENYKKQQKCKHDKWDCDTQIRVIECRECGKRAWIEDYRNLYK